MLNKEGWEKARERFAAWWAGESADRPVIQLYAGVERAMRESGWNAWHFVRHLDNPERTAAAFEEYCRLVYFGAEAYPDLLINFGPGVMAAFIGAEPQIREDTVWFETPMGWDEIDEKVVFDPENIWWKRVRGAAEAAVARSDGNFFVGMTDLGGNLDLAASLRGAQNLLFDMLDWPERVLELLKTINALWFRYYEEFDGVIRRRLEGTSSWMNIWCPGRWYPLQCDFSAMLSPEMFERFAGPFLQEQCRWLDHSIYHWDGPGQLPHLEILLDIPELDGIQWTPGAGNPEVGSPKWFPLYQRIQQRGKRVVLLGVAPDAIEGILRELSPKGLLISATCASEAEARELMRKVERLR
jgi:5-methyltetrahydrofolate--homocysteine methyltransferase